MMPPRAALMTKACGGSAASSEKPIRLVAVRAEWHVDRQDVGLREGCLEVGDRAVVAGLFDDVGLDVGVINGDRHAEGGAALWHFAADPAEAHDQDPAAEQVDRVQTVAHRPAAFPGCAVISKALLGQRQHEIQSMLGDCGRVGVGRDRERDFTGGEGGDVDVVVADAVARDDFQAQGLLDHRGGQQRGADRDGVGVTDLRHRLGLVRAVDDRKRDLGAGLEELHAVRVKRADDQDFRHFFFFSHFTNQGTAVGDPDPGVGAGTSPRSENQPYWKGSERAL